MVLNGALRCVALRRAALRCPRCVWFVTAGVSVMDKSLDERRKLLVKEMRPVMNHVHPFESLM
jgi:hypothetical protein